MNKLSFHQTGYTRPTLSTTVSKCAEENKLPFTHWQDSRRHGTQPLAQHVNTWICQSHCMQHFQNI